VIVVNSVMAAFFLPKCTNVARLAFDISDRVPRQRWDAGSGTPTSRDQKKSSAMIWRHVVSVHVPSMLGIRFNGQTEFTRHVEFGPGNRLRATYDRRSAKFGRYLFTPENPKTSPISGTYEIPGIDESRENLPRPRMHYRKARFPMTGSLAPR